LSYGLVAHGPHVAVGAADLIFCSAPASARGWRLRAQTSELPQQQAYASQSKSITQRLLSASGGRREQIKYGC